MFCKRCRYNLKAIESRACPECGWAFDPQNHKTYRQRVGWPKWVRRIGQGLAVLFVIALIAIGVIEWRYQHEASVVEQLNGRARWSDDAHQWAKWFPFLHGRLQHVVALSLFGNQVKTLPPNICELAQLESLDLDRNQLAILPADIGKLAQLEVLTLNGNQLTTFPPEIRKLRNLRGLYLADNPITDADLEYLKPLENLEYLYIGGTKVTAVGVATLKQAVPNCEIVSDFDEIRPFDYPR